MAETDKKSILHKRASRTEGKICDKTGRILLDLAFVFTNPRYERLSRKSDFTAVLYNIYKALIWIIHLVENETSTNFILHFRNISKERYRSASYKRAKESVSE